MKDVDTLKIDVPEQATPETEWKLTKVDRCGYYFKDIEKPDANVRFNEGKTRIIINEKQI